MNSAAAQNQNARPQVDWETAKEVKSDTTGIRVIVQKLPLFTPKFRITVAGTGREGQETRSIQPQVVIEGGEAKVQNMFGMELARMVDEALLFIQDEAQAAANRGFGRTQQRRGGASPLSAHMTPEQREAKKRRHENNLANRRAADQARTSKNKGK